MSSFINSKITCPNCKNEGGYTMWNSVNVDLNPELKLKVLDGSIFMWTCPHCGKEYKAPYPLLYHDMKNHFMIEYNPKDPFVLFVEHIKIMENNLDRNVILVMEHLFRKEHQGENILFNKLTESGDLEFDLYTMPDKCWVKTDRKHVVSMSDYKTNEIDISSKI